MTTITRTIIMRRTIDMYAKWIHPKRIVRHEGNVLRSDGRITINPTKNDYIRAEYYPVIIEEGQSLTNPDNIYIVRDKTIVLLKEEE